MIILEDLNFAWEKEEIDRVMELWKDGVNVISIEKDIDRNTEEVFLLLMHLSRQGKIKKREGYFWGRKDVENENMGSIDGRKCR